MAALTIAGSVFGVAGLLVCRAADKANNGAAWTLYGCIPTGIGVALIAGALMERML